MKLEEPQQPYPSSPPQWQQEHTFWFEQGQRAFIRWQDACDRGDKSGAKKFNEQRELYHRRMLAVEPKWFQERCAQRAKQIRAAALAES